MKVATTMKVHYVFVLLFLVFFLQILNDNKHNKGGRLLCVDAGTKEERINI